MEEQLCCFMEVGWAKIIDRILLNGINKTHIVLIPLWSNEKECLFFPNLLFGFLVINLQLADMFADLIFLSRNNSAYGYVVCQNFSKPQGVSEANYYSRARIMLQNLGLKKSKKI